MGFPSNRRSKTLPDPASVQVHVSASPSMQTDLTQSLPPLCFPTLNIDRCLAGCPACAQHWATGKRRRESSAATACLCRNYSYWGRRGQWPHKCVSISPGQRMFAKGGVSGLVWGVGTGIMERVASEPTLEGWAVTKKNTEATVRFQGRGERVDLRS